MKADLAKREPGILEFWEKLDLYHLLLKTREGRPEFVLHDGPPYANGPIHMGHVLNKVLKDMSVKSRGLMGMRTPYVPGWDCHGLPIETALLKEMKISKRAIQDLPAFRRQAAEFADRWIGIQREGFKRLGVLGEWADPYRTMAPKYEARILQAFRVLMSKGHIYRGLRTVYWCGPCETALAEAEVEYKDKTSRSVYVAFRPMAGAGAPSGKGEQPPSGDHAGDACVLLSQAQALIWTTTPWTLPANTGLAFHPRLEYVLVKVHWADQDHRWVMAKARRDAVCAELGAKVAATEGSWTGEELVKLLRCSRPFYPEKESKAVLADYVSSEDGTGIVHTAPGHGHDDFETGRTHGLDIISPVDVSARFTDEAPEPLRGKKVLKEGNDASVDLLGSQGLLLHASEVRHSYPHCWRCKTPIVFRATEQWFLNVKHGSLRGELLDAIEKVNWVPAVGKTRISSMVSSRPDWCLSRQRVWGTPIPVLYCASCGDPLKDDATLSAIEAEVEKQGTDFWFKDLEAEVSVKDWPFLAGAKCPACGHASFRRERDILDVWIDSGASWLGVRPKGAEQADLYLEGSDQHRGWFQSSLVLSVGLEGRAPYRSVVTHGFLLDERGHAMHKSAGNAVDPQTVIDKLGADVLRLWVALCDYSDDVRISEKLLDGPKDAYRKVRNTLRYILGNIHDFEGDRPEALPELERYVLGRLAALQTSVLEHYRHYRFRAATRELVDFCAFDLSAFYLDVLKDRLYTFAKDHPERRAAQWVMTEVLRRVLQLLSPILSFTAEEAWQSLPERLRPAGEEGTQAMPASSGERSTCACGDDGPRAIESVFLADLPPVEPEWTDPELARRWEVILRVRSVVQKSLEEQRAAGKIGSSLQAHVTLKGEDVGRLGEVAWPAVLIVSSVDPAGGDGGLEVEVRPADGAKCPRCWRFQTDIGSASSSPELCGRCAAQLAS